MLIFSKNISKKTIITLWKIEEPPSYFLDYLGINEIDLATVSNATHPIKQLEWLASRSCVKQCVEILEHTYLGIEKDCHNNPYLIDVQGFVSLSHTNEYAVAVVSLEEEVGIDIESCILHIKHPDGAMIGLTAKTGQGQFCSRD